MVSDRIDNLRQEYIDKYVVVDGDRPELARFREMVGQVRTINYGGRALVEFDANNNRGWYDIGLDYLRVVDKPEPKPPEPREKPAGKKEKKAPAAQPDGEKKLSPLELARLEKEAGTADTDSTNEAPAGDSPQEAGQSPDKPS